MTARALDLNAAGDYASTPVPAVVEPIQSLDVRAWVTLDDGTPTPDAPLVTRWAGGGASSFWFNVNANGHLFMPWTSDGSSVRWRSSGVPVPNLDRAKTHVRAVLDITPTTDTTRFYYSTENTLNPTTWTQLGATVSAAAVGPLFNPAPAFQFRVGSREDAPTEFVAGQVHAVSVRMNNIVVANPDFTSAPTSGTFADGVGNTWTRSGNATILTYDTPATSSSRALGLGAVGSFASTPDPTSEALPLTWDLRAWIALDDWTPAAAAPTTAQWGGGGVGSFGFFVVPSGALYLDYTDNTPTNYAAQSAVLPPIGNGVKAHVRCTVTANNGNAQREVQFYYSLEDTPTPTWIQAGLNVNNFGPPLTGLANSTKPLRIGADEWGQQLLGKVYSASVRVNGVVVANPNFMSAPASAYADGVGNIWTLTGGAKYVDTAGGGSRYDEKARALSQWAVNHPEYGESTHELWLKWAAANALSPSALSGFDIAARDAKFVALSSSLSLPALTAPAGAYQSREGEFWKNYANKPPVPAA